MSVQPRLPTWDIAAATLRTSTWKRSGCTEIAPLVGLCQCRVLSVVTATRPESYTSFATKQGMLMTGEGRAAVASSVRSRPGDGLNGSESAARRQWSDPLSRGGLALLINTGLTGVLGFGYWIIAARLFSTYAVGVAGALVAATTLFSGIGQLNLSGMLMRFLPKAGGKSRRLVLATYVLRCKRISIACADIPGRHKDLRLPNIAIAPWHSSVDSPCAGGRGHGNLHDRG